MNPERKKYMTTTKRTRYIPQRRSSETALVSAVETTETIG
jgi:hypothetical protein